MIKTYSTYILSTWLLVACMSGPEQLTPEERYMIDTMYSARQTQYKMEADSLCALKTDSIFDAAVDSIMQYRLDEIELLTGSREILNYVKRRESGE